MEAVLAHVQEWWIAYAAGAACVLPLVYFTRRYSLPPLMWIGELLAYTVVMHVVLHLFVILTKWFKLNTTMYWQEKVDPGWKTPLDRFWDRGEYNPGWLFYCEVVIIVLMIVAMIRYRPLKTQRILPKRQHLYKGRTPESLRSKHLGRSASPPSAKPPGRRR